MEHKPSLVGGACIIAGVCVGLACWACRVRRGAWSLWSMLAVALTMVVMTVSGWMLLESLSWLSPARLLRYRDRDLLGRR